MSRRWIADQALFDYLTSRGPVVNESVEQIVRGILGDVRARGTAALLTSARQFDAPGLGSVYVDAAELASATLDPSVQSAIQTAADRIRRFHEAQRSVLLEATQMIHGCHQWWLREGRPAAASLTHFGDLTNVARVGQRVQPIRRVGVYVPGGNAAYPSSVLMNAIPAIVAGVESLVVTTPARRDGTLPPAVAVALRQLELGDRLTVVKVGGAAAIAALTFGTEELAPVDLIVGPGNAYVNEAKRQVWGRVGLDGYAGPSEVAVVVDESCQPEWAAADLLTQIEHAPDNAGFLIGWNGEVLDRVVSFLEDRLLQLPESAAPRRAWRENSHVILAASQVEAQRVVEAIAPEHVTLAVESPGEFAEGVRNAGCLLLGDYSAESAGDYLAGPSHTLPTARAARFQSPVNVLTFLRWQSVIQWDAPTAEQYAGVIDVLAREEGFPLHAEGATIRTSTRAGTQ